VNEKQQERVIAIISSQLAMNPQTLAALLDAGLRPDDEVHLDFVFLAPDEKRAVVLKSHLEQSDCLDVTVQKRGGLLSRSFEVTGRSLPTTVSVELLDEWVKWMVVQGMERDCEFDGWGALLPR
jgi:hypothetical protein